MIVLAFVLLFALIGAPIFAVMAGSAELAWLTHENETLHHVRFLAPDVLDERFAGSPILVTVPLFTFIGYVMAESQAPQRIVRASDAFLGWLPGGLAIVCIFASAFFTTLTGGSAVTIVAVGALLYPALVRYGYPRDYSLGLVMTGGSLGLLLPPSLPILIYSLVAGIDFTKAFKSGLIPGFLIMVLLSIQAMYMGVKYKIPRTKPSAGEMAGSLWSIKWELFLPVLILGSLGVGLADVDEAAALAAAYIIGVEFLIHKDLDLKKDLARIVKASMALAGALVLIMAMATALTNYIISEGIPTRIFRFVTEEVGVKDKVTFLFTLNIFMLVMGMLMEGISAILVAVPLLIPFAAEFHLSPFHLAMMFLLNLEIAFMAPPFGQNLFVAAFRFNRPMTSLYRLILPFIGVLSIALVMVMYVPRLSTLLVEGDIVEAKAVSAERCEAPRDAWKMECTQEDRNNPLPCVEREMACWIDPASKTGSKDDVHQVLSAEDVALADMKRPEAQRCMPSKCAGVLGVQPEPETAPTPSAAPSGSAAPAPTDEPPEDEGDDEDDLDKAFDDDAPTPAASASAPAASASAAPAEPPADEGDDDEDLDKAFD